MEYNYLSKCIDQAVSAFKDQREQMESESPIYNEGKCKVSF